MVKKQFVKKWLNILGRFGSFLTKKIDFEKNFARFFGK